MDDERVFDEGIAWARKCTCGRRFYQPNSYTNHINGCTAYKNNVGSSLKSARERYREKGGKTKKGRAAMASWFGEGDLDIDVVLPQAGPSQLTKPSQDSDEPEHADLPVSLPADFKFVHSSN